MLGVGKFTWSGGVEKHRSSRLMFIFLFLFFVFLEGFGEIPHCIKAAES